MREGRGRVGAWKYVCRVLMQVCTYAWKGVRHFAGGEHVRVWMCVGLGGGGTIEGTFDVGIVEMERSLTWEWR